MGIKFGDYATEPAGVSLEEGEYPAKIVKAALPRDDATGEFVLSFGKNVVDVTFDVEGEEVRRRYSISFGQNSESKQWAAFAELLAAACGVPCGSPSQRHLGTADLEGQTCRVILKQVEKNGKTYMNVVNVLAPKGAKAAKQPAPRREEPRPQDDLEDEIPF